ncbi:MAG: hypothetical protein AABZ67_00675 [Pseudomonadota bacterium]
MAGDLAGKPERPIEAEYEIRRDIPVPAARGGSPALRAKYPWAECTVGDAFVVPVEFGEDIAKVVARLGAIAYKRAKSEGKGKWSVRKGADGAPEVVVQRVA